jgi:hypothetical protein
MTDQVYKAQDVLLELPQPSHVILPHAYDIPTEKQTILKCPFSLYANYRTVSVNRPRSTPSNTYSLNYLVNVYNTCTYLRISSASLKTVCTSDQTCGLSREVTSSVEALVTELATVSPLYSLKKRAGTLFSFNF